MNKKRILKLCEDGISVREIATKTGERVKDVREFLQSVGVILAGRDMGPGYRSSNYASTYRRTDSMTPAQVCEWMRHWPRGISEGLR
ncbi:MAG: hypothetical protein IIB77_06930 [Proteobacteria bacterium]|nr:hypothetical protein [Pseudomonadota bacterium]